MDLDDDIYALQDGNAVQNEANDKILGSYMKNHEDEGHVTGLEPIDNNETINEVQRIYSEAEKEIKKEQEEIVMLEAEIGNYESYEFASEEDRDAAIGEKQAEISGHNENINNIVKDRDDKIKDLLSRNSREKVNDEQQEQSPNTDGKIRNRYTESTPNNPNVF